MISLRLLRGKSVTGSSYEGVVQGAATQPFDGMSTRPRGRCIISTVDQCLLIFPVVNNAASKNFDKPELHSIGTTDKIVAKTIA